MTKQAERTNKCQSESNAGRNAAFAVMLDMIPVCCLVCRVFSVSSVM